MSTHSNANITAEFQAIRQTLRTMGADNPADTEKSALITRYNELVDTLWQQHTTHRLDPAKYLPIEIVNSIFSLTIYHVVELEPGNPVLPGRLTMPSRGTMVCYRDAPLILASVNRTWCQIAVNHPLLWSTIIIDRSEDDYLERIYLFLNRSGKVPLDIVLLDQITPTTPLQGLLLKHAHRFKTFVGHSAEIDFENFPLARLEPLDSSSDFVNWSVYASISRRISTVPIPKCLHRVQLYQWTFDPESLIQFTYFPNLESLSISIELELKDTQWDKMLRFERLRYLRLCVSNAQWAEGSMLESPWIEWLECPVLVDLYISYELNQEPSLEMYPQLEACLLRFRFLRNLRVYMYAEEATDQDYASAFQNMRPSTFGGSLELVHITFLVSYLESEAWAGAFTERFFSVFVPRTHLTWEYAQFPSPTIFANLKKMHIVNWMTGDRSALVAPAMIKLEFPALEELYLENFENDVPGLLDFHAPHLISLRVSYFIPSDLRHISSSRSLISFIHLESHELITDSWETYLPSADRLQLDLHISDLFVLNVHPSQIHSVTMNINWNKTIICPPHWTRDYVPEMLGIVTDLNLEYRPSVSGFEDPSQTIIPFLKPFVDLKNLTLFRSILDNSNWIDQLAQHLVDPNFLPALEALSSSEYPFWPDFFRCIQRRQSGFLTGQFQTSLKEVTIKGPVHGVLLEHLRESIAGRRTDLLCMPPRHLGSKEWPIPPFDCTKLDTNGILCCYSCYKAGLEMGCVILPSENASEMLRCYKFNSDQRTNSVFAP